MDTTKPHIADVSGPSPDGWWIFTIDPVDNRAGVKRWVSEHLSGDDWLLMDIPDSVMLYLSCDDQDACTIKLSFQV